MRVDVGASVQEQVLFSWEFKTQTENRIDFLVSVVDDIIRRIFSNVWHFIEMIGCVFRSMKFIISDR